MKYQKLYWILSVFTLFFPFDYLWGMHDAGRTEELKQYLSDIVITFNTNKSRPSNTALFHTIKEFVLHRADPNIATDTNLNGTSAIHFAAEFGADDLLKFLLDSGVHIETSDVNGNTPLHWAAKSGREDTIGLVVRLGGNIESKNVSGYTPLCRAASNGHQNAVDRLVSLGANIHVKINTYYTPIKVAAKRAHSEVVIHILSFGANDGEAAFRCARGKAKEVLARYFSKEGILGDENQICALIRLKNEDIGKIDASPDEIKEINNKPDAYKNTPLDVALVTRNDHVIPRLLALGADPWAGLFDGVSLAYRIPEFKERENNKPSIYEQILYVPLHRYWLFKEFLMKKKLIKDVVDQIIKLEIACRRM